MTDTNNGWPGQPGVPLNPERDGRHWRKSFKVGSKPVASFWCASEMVWQDGPMTYVTVGIAAQHHYLGPCLTSEEATALRARVEELEGVLLEARDDLTEWIDVAHQHREKYPHIMQDFENDMEIVRRIDAALEGKKDE